MKLGEVVKWRSYLRGPRIPITEKRDVGCGVARSEYDWLKISVWFAALGFSLFCWWLAFIGVRSLVRCFS